jgi:Na+/H+ antiporter NhaD/arsenite permease-like protein
MMIVVANLRLSGFFALVSEWVVDHTHRPPVLLAGIVLVSGVFSAFFVNDTMCLVLTMSSTLAGNLTVPGSVANLIVIERARREVRTGFWEYAKAGVPLTVVSLALGVWMLG